jgi:hypothetical protein
MLSVGAGRLFSIMSDAVFAAAALPAALQARTCALFIPEKTEFNHKVHAEHAGDYRILAGAMLLEGMHSQEGAGGRRSDQSNSNILE